MGVELMPAAGVPGAGRSRAGFTLLEVLIAMALFLVVALGILPLFTQSMTSNLSGRESTVAANFARSRVEQFFQLAFNSADLTIDDGTEKVFEDYYSEQDDEWKDGAAPLDGSDPAVWTRTTTVRQYSSNALEDGTLDPATEALPAGTDPNFIHLKEILVELEGTREGGPLLPAKRIALRALKSQ